MKSGPVTVARQSGGTRSTFGDFDSERMEDQAIQGATAQKAIQQQASNTKTQPQANAGNRASSAQTPASPPREIGSLAEELITRPITDTTKELAKFFDLNALLGINSGDTPEEKQKKVAMHQRFQKLTQAEQQVAQEKYQQELKKKQAEEQLKQEKKQRAMQQQQATLVIPAGKSDQPGLPIGGNTKQRAQTRLKQQMTTISTLSDGG